MHGGSAALKADTDNLLLYYLLLYFVNKSVMLHFIPACVAADGVGTNTGLGKNTSNNTA